MVGPTHLIEVVLAAPTPRTGGGDRPPLWVQRRASLSSGARERAREKASTAEKGKAKGEDAAGEQVAVTPGAPQELDPYRVR